jgi:CRP-like cAMP-binding protein
MRDLLLCLHWSVFVMSETPSARPKGKRRFIDAINPQFRALVLQNANVVKAQPGQVLMSPLKPTTSLLIILEGTATVGLCSDDGRSVTMNIVSRGDIAGDIAFSAGTPSNVQLIARTRCVIACIPFNRLERLLSISAEFRDA